MIDAKDLYRLHTSLTLSRDELVCHADNDPIRVDKEGLPLSAEDEAVGNVLQAATYIDLAMGEIESAIEKLDPEFYDREFCK